MEEVLNFAKITSLALADSVNPCAIAVLTMVLITVLIQNPEKRKRILVSGLAFVASVYIGYLFYGLIIIQFFKTFAEILREHSSIIYNGLGIFAMIMGSLNIKDFFMYKPGNFGTEMPIWMRPKVKRIIGEIHSTRGAFVIGFLVTIFLLPCTIGPYIVASGILSNLGFVGAIPWLLYYNILFVSPMILIVGLVYFGFKKVDEISGWKERNIKTLHLVAGVLLFLVGVAMLMRWL